MVLPTRKAVIQASRKLKRPFPEILSNQRLLGSASAVVVGSPRSLALLLRAGTEAARGRWSGQEGVAKLASPFSQALYAHF
ncbi:hypothetical protein J2778_004899 [Paraburkholderia graminis]|nr:hypothetical protein [Paraburkholderia graminis]